MSTSTSDRTTKVFHPSKVIIASVDFETLGLQSDAVITGLGAAIDGPRRRWTLSHFPIDGITGQYRRNMDPATVTFWRTQSNHDLRLAFETSMAGRGITLAEAIDDLLTTCETAIKYHGEGSSIYWVFKPAIFDGPLLSSACEQLGGDFMKRLDAVSGGVYRRQAFDLNSLEFVAKMGGVVTPRFPKPELLHNPGSDALAQLNAYKGVMDALKAAMQAAATTGPASTAAETVDPHAGLTARQDGLPAPRLFTMVRPVDETGVSGTGHVLDGVVWPDNRVTVYWRTETPSVNAYDSFEDFHKVHVSSHPGNGTEIVFTPAPAPAPAVIDGEKISNVVAPQKRSFTRAAMREAQSLPAQCVELTDIASRVKADPAFETQMQSKEEPRVRVLRSGSIGDSGEDVDPEDIHVGTKPVIVADEQARIRGDEQRRIQRVVEESFAAHSNTLAKTGITSTFRGVDAGAA